MHIKYNRTPYKKDYTRVNHRIRAREVRVILGSNGKQLGVMTSEEALRKAKAYGLDLIEVSPTAKPPVCKIADYGKYKYEKEKHDKEKKQQQTKVKEIKFRVKIGTHDYETKLRHAEEFLDRGNKIKIQLQFRGREMAHKDLGMEMMHKIAEDLVQMATIDVPPKLVGRAISMMLTPLPANKRKRHFFSHHDLEAIEEEELEISLNDDLHEDLEDDGEKEAEPPEKVDSELSEE